MHPCFNFVALFLGLPQPWLESNTALLVNTIAYFIVNQSPGDIVYNFLESVAPIGDLIMFTLDGLQKGYNITNGGVDLVRLKMKGQAVSNSLPGMAIIAMLSGSGGGVIADFFNLTSNTWQFRTPTILTQNSSPSPSPLPPVGASRFTKFQLPLNYDMKISLFAGLTYILSARLWTFSEHAPNFALSGIIDAFIDQILPRLTEKEARLVVGTMVATLNGYGSYIQHCNFMRIKNSSKSNQPSEKNQNVKKPESKKSK
ncbi:hypothetical protein AX774_g1602 [Zancudomyces culisetae]|uniref:Uncharacterized protein n=1 Tax=Zancudomyces culisetae TaxID=1213189 RepID=A0A1R1PVB3_ZANCU|nr:hypothetical protein AX774_g6866 [Zancudomyces culisetae]OMH84869.1 hypothetical protein AX774_g1602 [Zancudomyces culisetae]|eukprot:OMH79716.1 hypothetical protein AX774_g6866 [Zancudomyces culisetae]